MIEAITTSPLERYLFNIIVDCWINFGNRILLFVFQYYMEYDELLNRNIVLYPLKIL